MITQNAQINAVIMMGHVPANLVTMVTTVKIALKDTFYLMLSMVTKYALVSILLDELNKNIKFFE